jgi:hypothetical protein
MRVRALDADGDMQFGRSQGYFLIDSPAAVAQCIATRLGLLRSEWFLNVEDGADWNAEVLGSNTAATRDIEIRRIILGTPGVTEISAYGAQFDPFAREYSVQASVATQYGETTITATV